MDDLTIDREFDDLCPALTSDEERLLEQSILTDGCLHSIIVWANHDDTILDGHNRYRLCKKHGRKITTKAIKIDSREDAKAWIIRTQIGRRNLSESQRAILAAKLVNSHAGGDRKSDQKPNSANDITVEKAAEEFNVGKTSVKDAKKVIEQGAKPLQKAVESGEVAVSVAAKVSALPKAEQAKIVSKGAEAVKAAAKKVTQKNQSDKPKKYDDEFDTVKMAVDSKDAFGDSPPEELRQAFELREGFKAQRDKLTSIKTWMTQNMNHPGAVILKDAKDRLRTDIDQADSELKFAMPYCVCVYCHNKDPKVANCTACKGLGWITEPIYKAAPKGMQREKAKP